MRDCLQVPVYLRKVPSFRGKKNKARSGRREKKNKKTEQQVKRQTTTVCTRERGTARQEPDAGRFQTRKINLVQENHAPLRALHKVLVEQSMLTVKGGVNIRFPPRSEYAFQLGGPTLYTLQSSTPEYIRYVYQ